MSGQRRSWFSKAPVDLVRLQSAERWKGATCPLGGRRRRLPEAVVAAWQSVLHLFRKLIKWSYSSPTPSHGATGRFF